MTIAVAAAGAAMTTTSDPEDDKPNIGEIAPVRDIPDSMFEKISNPSQAIIRE